MTDSSEATIRFLDSRQAYADGAEDAVLAALDRVADLSDGSDELARRAVDWPTLYHFSPKRSNLLRPLAVPSRVRVLEIGAGTGAVTRYLGEHATAVVALEGDAARAEAVARRCDDLDTVEVVCGPLAELDEPEPFDLVVSVGVLEYAGSCSPGLDDQMEFLARAGDLVTPDGAMVLAIENRLGLKYLLGFAEDHLGEPWAGVEGYPGRPAVCTVSRAELRRALEGLGFTAQRWFYPFPDYKLPRVVLAEAAYGLADATTVIDHLVGRPVLDLAHPPSRLCDDRAAHRSFLDAGLGPDVANSFLIVAARSDAGLEAVTDATALAWHFSSDRRRPLRRAQVLRRGSDESLRLTGRPVAPEDTADLPEWLGHEPGKSAPFHRGPTLEQRAIEAARNRDLDDLTRVLEEWHRRLAEVEQPAPEAEATTAPFTAVSNRPALPPEYLDASLSNFIDTGSGLEFVDREWRLVPAADAALVRYRALWYLAVELVMGGSPHPFGADADITTIAAELAGLVGLEAGDDTATTFVRDEAVLQAAVTGEPADRIEARLAELGATSRGDRSAAVTVPVAQLRRDLVELATIVDRLRSELAAERAASAAALEEARAHERRLTDDIERSAELLEEARAYRQRLETELEGAGSQIDEARRYQQRLEGELAGASDRAAAAEADRARLETELAEATGAIRTVEAELAGLESWRASTVRRPLVRLALAGHRLLDRLRGRRS